MQKIKNMSDCKIDSKITNSKLIEVCGTLDAGLGLGALIYGVPNSCNAKSIKDFVIQCLILMFVGISIATTGFVLEHKLTTEKEKRLTLGKWGI